jgi:NTE family protein
VTRVVCALSGGGAKAAAHLGAIRALTERGLAPAHYVGTSMGGLVGAALAAGMTPGAVLAALQRGEARAVASPSPGLLLGVFADGLFRPGPFRSLIRRLVPARRFADLAVPLTVTAVDLESGELVLFGAGGRDDVPLEDALYATCALPLYFPPARIGGRLYVDGGLRAVLPLDAAAGFAPDLIFAVDVGPSWREAPSDRKAKVPAMVRRSGQVQRVMMAAQTETQLERWRARPPGARPRLVVVQPPVMAETTFRLDLVGEYDAAGYEAAKTALEDRVGGRTANG